MDPFSLTAGVAGLLSLTIQLTRTLSEYASSVKNAVSESHNLALELSSLVTTLRQLERFFKDHTDNGAFCESSIIYSTMKKCHARLHSIELPLKKFMDSTKERSKLWQRCVKWPLEKREHQQTVESIRHCVQIFEFSLSINGW